MAKKDAIRGRVKRNWQRNVTAVLVATVTFFVLFFVPHEITDPILNRGETWVRLLAKLGASLPFMFLMGWIIFAQDHLATGRSAASEFYRHHYPSSLAVRKYGLPRPDADRTWFDYFNAWESEKHQYHDDYERTFERGYSLRLIFYLKRVLAGFVLFAALAMIGAEVFKTADAVAWRAPRIALIALAAALWAWLHFSNRFFKNTTGTPGYDATGAYQRYQEIQGIVASRFERDVLALLPRPGAEGTAVPRATIETGTKARGG